MDNLTYQILLAFALDLVMGDPYWLPHPVRAIGKSIEWGEKALRVLIPWERLAGIILTLIIVTGTYFTVARILNYFQYHGPFWY
ncbi:MAG TPA: cobalamin biosynthesis protein, partial [Candidatus Tripitaka californicus]